MLKNLIIACLITIVASTFAQSHSAGGNQNSLIKINWGTPLKHCPNELAIYYFSNYVFMYSGSLDINDDFTCFDANTFAIKYTKTLKIKSDHFAGHLRGFVTVNNQLYALGLAPDGGSVRYFATRINPATGEQMGQPIKVLDFKLHINNPNEAQVAVHYSPDSSKIMFSIGLGLWHYDDHSEKGSEIVSVFDENFEKVWSTGFLDKSEKYHVNSLAVSNDGSGAAFVLETGGQYGTDIKKMSLIVCSPDGEKSKVGLEINHPYLHGFLVKGSGEGNFYFASVYGDKSALNNSVKANIEGISTGIKVVYFDRKGINKEHDFPYDEKIFYAVKPGDKPAGKKVYNIITTLDKIIPNPDGTVTIIARDYNFYGCPIIAHWKVDNASSDSWINTVAIQDYTSEGRYIYGFYSFSKDGKLYLLYNDRYEDPASTDKKAKGNSELIAPTLLEISGNGSVQKTSLGHYEGYYYISPRNTFEIKPMEYVTLGQGLKNSKSFTLGRVSLKLP